MEREELEQKIQELIENKEEWQSNIEGLRGGIAGCQEELDQPSTTEERRAELEREVQNREDSIQAYKQYIAEEDTALDNARAALAKLDGALGSSPPSDAPSPPSGDPSTPPTTSSADNEMYQAAMKEGYMDLQTSDGVLLGVAGSGKTSSLTMAVDQTVPDKRVSTPCAKVPVRTVSHTRIGVGDDKLSRIEEEAYFNTVSHTVMEVARSIDRHKAVSSPAPPVVQPIIPNHLHKLEKEIIRCVYDKKRPYSLLYDSRWSKLTDSGGQPQFLELLPIFIHHISLGIFTIKLNERLDHHPMIEYYGEDGKPVGNSYRSYLSNEQIIRRCMRALISQGSGAKKFTFLFLGTHLDLKEESVGESIDDKNFKLRKIVRSFKMNSHVVYSNRLLKNLIFAINAKNPGPNDWEVIKQVRRAIVDSSNVPAIHIPIRWFAMELALLRFVKESGQAVLLEDACFKMVERYSKQDDFKAALKYLHQAKLIFHFEKGRLVVADMQMILDKLSQVVRYNIELVTNPTQHAALSDMWMKFCRHGILNIKCLEKFPEGYIKDVFSPKELLELFVHLCIVSQMKPGEFLMPCLLEVEACCNPDPTTQAVPALAVEFPNGGPVLGSYCRLICYLINEKKWELALDEDGEPYHLSRSSIHFSLPNGLPGSVSIDDPLSSFFAIWFHGFPKVASKICPLIRETILTGLEEVTGSLSYLPQDEATGDAEANKPEVTFMCSCQGTPLHPATISSDADFLKCSENSLRGEEITNKHKIWFGGAVPKPVSPPSVWTPSASAAPPPSMPSPRHLILIRYKTEQGCDSHEQKFELVDRVSACWREFGLLLDVTPNVLDGWNKQFLADARDCWIHVMQRWLEGRSRTYPASWEGLYDLVEDAGYAAVAVELKEVVEKLAQ